MVWLSLFVAALIAAVQVEERATLVRPPEVDAATAKQYGVDLDVLRRYEVLDFRYSGGSLGDERVQCGIIRPRQEVAGQSYPLIVWLHGLGPEELNQEFQRGHLRWIEQTVFSDAQSSTDHACYLLAMQLPGDSQEWFRSPGDPPLNGAADRGNEPLTLLRELVRHVVQSYAVDQDRIYLVGISAGGTACFEVAMRYPELVAAFVPLASSGGDLSRAHKLAHIPIWAFHAKGDHPESIRETIAAISAAGGPAHLTEVPGSHHYCWIPAFQDYRVLDWLFAQRRGVAGPAPETAPWPWTTPGIVAAVVLIVCAGWWSEKKRREREAKSKQLKSIETWDNESATL